MQENSNQIIKLGNQQFEIVDSMQNFRAEDSFIHRSNKLQQYKGNGESKKHVGTYAGENAERLSAFFEYDKWGLPHWEVIGKQKRKTVNSALKAGAVVQNGTCFFSKANLLQYMRDAREEYLNQEQVYHNDIKEFYGPRLNGLESLEQEFLRFTIYDASDNWGQKQDRGYIRSDDEIWGIWRELILPKISYLSILKLKPVGANSDYEASFFFRIMLDYQFRSFVHRGASTELTAESTESNRQESKKYRVGQEKYRREVIDLMPQCPFTKISDERLLVASHIKPYIICLREGKDDEIYDSKNGLALTPTYDKLFDQGYITFTDDGRLICGSLISPYTWQKLGINPNAKNVLRIYPEGREGYLEFHRNNVFLESVEEFL